MSDIVLVLDIWLQDNPACRQTGVWSVFWQFARNSGFWACSSFLGASLHVSLFFLFKRCFCLLSVLCNLCSVFSGSPLGGRTGERQSSLAWRLPVQAPWQRSLLLVGGQGVPINPEVKEGAERGQEGNMMSALWKTQRLRNAILSDLPTGRQVLPFNQITWCHECEGGFKMQMIFFLQKTFSPYH